MKKILIAIISLFVITKTFAQAPHPTGSHVLNADLDKFVGTWIWASSTETVKIILQKQTIHFPEPLNYDEDVLVGWHEYIVNGNTNQSSISNVGLPYLWSSPDRVSLFGSTKTSDQVYFTRFLDYGKNKTCELYLTLLPNSNTQAAWKLRNPRGLKSGGYDYGFSLPSSLILIKQ